MSPSDSTTGSQPAPAQTLRQLRRVRQYRDFSPDAVAPDALDAIVDVARWSGSSRNTQPWRFIVVRDPSTIRQLHDAGLPQTRGLRTAPSAIAIALPVDSRFEVAYAFDEGRAAERMLIAAAMLGLGAGISWLVRDARPVAARLLHLLPDHEVRTVVAIGHPSEAALQPKSQPGKARLARHEVVFEETWPEG